MTIDEQRMVVLEWMGWTDIFRATGKEEWLGTFKEEYSGTLLGWSPMSGDDAVEIPRLTLDWVHEAEKKLKSHQMERYARKLAIVVGDVKMEDYQQFYLIHATAEQRLAALVETIKEI